MNEKYDSVVPAETIQPPKVIVIQGRNMLYDYELRDFGNERASKWDIGKTSIRWWTLPKTLENLQKKGVKIFVLAEYDWEEKAITLSGLGNAISGLILKKDLDVKKLCERTKTEPKDILYIGRPDSIHTLMPENGRLFEQAGARYEAVCDTFKHPSQNNDLYMQMLEKTLAKLYGADIQAPDLGYEILAFGNGVTLVSKGQPVSERLVSMLQKLREQGIRIFQISFDTLPSVDGLPQGLVEPAVVDCSKDEFQDKLGIDRSCVRTLYITGESVSGSKNGGWASDSLNWMGFAKTADGKIDVEDVLEKVFGEEIIGKIPPLSLEQQVELAIFKKAVALGHVPPFVQVPDLTRLSEYPDLVQAVENTTSLERRYAKLIKQIDDLWGLVQSNPDAKSELDTIRYTLVCDVEGKIKAYFYTVAEHGIGAGSEALDKMEKCIIESQSIYDKIAKDALPKKRFAILLLDVKMAEQLNDTFSSYGKETLEIIKQKLSSAGIAVITLMPKLKEVKPKELGEYEFVLQIPGRDATTMPPIESANMLTKYVQSLGIDRNNVYIFVPSSFLDRNLTKELSNLVTLGAYSQILTRQNLASLKKAVDEKLRITNPDPLPKPKQWVVRSLVGRFNEWRHRNKNPVG